MGRIIFLVKIMKAYLALAAIAAVFLSGEADAINLKLVQKVEEKVIAQDGPTNGEMAEDEKDTLIQVLCPGFIQTSFSKTTGKSSTCNTGAKAASKSFVQESETVGDTEIA